MEFDQNRIYYVYEWFLIENQEVFYVGKGKKYRYRSRKRGENPVFTEFVKTHNCDSRIVKIGLNEEEAYLFEKELISFYRNNGANLINVHEGGHMPPSALGLKRSDETKKKMSESFKKYAVEHPERNKAISERMKAFFETDAGKEFRKKSLEARRSKEFREAQSIRSRTANNTEEYKTKQSLLVKRMWDNDKYREAHTGKNNISAISVFQCDLNGNILNRYDTMTEASKATGVSISKISSVARGKRKTAGGYIWKVDSEKKEYIPRKATVKKVNDSCCVPILQYDLSGKFVAEYKSTASAVKLNSFPSRTNITANLKNKSKTAYGYIWKYKQGNTVPSQLWE